MSNTTPDVATRQRLRLLESVIANTNDAVLITEIEPLHEPGPRILYVNDAFTRLTGYTSEEVIGRSPRFLQGPLSDTAALRKLGVAMRRFESHEVDTVNYKKNGEAFWVNFTVNAVADEDGTFTHFIAIERDITGRRIRELRSALLEDITLVFNEGQPLQPTLTSVLQLILTHGRFEYAEIWLVSPDGGRIVRTSHVEIEASTSVSNTEPSDHLNIERGEGNVGRTWDRGEIQTWNVQDEDVPLEHSSAITQLGITTMYGLPLKHDKEVIAVMVIGSAQRRDSHKHLRTLLKGFEAPLCAEIKRKQLEEELDRLFHFAPDAMVIAGLDGYFRRVNRALGIMLGYTTEELMSRPFLDLVHPDDLERTREVMQNATSGDTIYSLENRQITKTGEVRWIAWTASFLVDDGYVHAVGKDVTDRKVAEAEVLKGLKEKDEILESIGDGFIAVDKDWKVVYWNASAERMLGLTSQETFGRNLWDIYADAVDSKFYRNYMQALEAKLPVHFEEFYPTLNKWFSIHAYPSSTGLAVYFQEITDRMESMQVLAESEKRYSDIFHLSPVPMFIVDDTTLAFIDANQSALDNYQYTLEEFLTKGVRDLLPAEPDEQYNALITKVRAERDLPIHGPYAHCRKDGTILLAEVRMHQFQYKDRSATIVIATDVTERSAYVNTIESQNKTLRDITWMQSHLVRAPLVRIMGLVELAGTEYPEEYKRMDYLQHLVTSAKELDDIIHDIHDKANSLEG